ncbi:uncharacterized protein LOC131851654 [Achroia grisella]|uniref:uncharacterized protein LOC131851654 n=1 Tax=Achroia grisella TaxID=688607 RepID=UPI0027D2BA24|nr:uncharacterized protein LOC131851654 [Achroia grisella]
MTTTVKCASCNIVINELLAYVQNKISIVDEESLVKICLSSFNSDQINEAKTLLFESLSADHRKKPRKGQGRENRELKDIISLFKVADPDIMPVFVARELEKLPPITFDHLDVSKLLKDLLLVQAEIKEIKSSYVTLNQLEVVKNQIQNTTIGAVTPFSVHNINIKRGAAYEDSGPIGLPHLNDSALTDENNISQCAISANNSSLKYQNININQMEGREITELNATLLSPLGVSGDGGDGGEKRGEGDEVRYDSRCNGAEGENYASSPTLAKERFDQTVASNDCTYANVLKSNASEVIDSKAKQKWTLVRNKKPYKNIRFTGKMGNSNIEPEQKFRAADRKIPIFITNVHMGTLKSDISNYIYSKTNETVNLEKITMKRKSEYDAYKFFVAQSKEQLFLDEKLWPKGIIFRLSIFWHI